MTKRAHENLWEEFRRWLLNEGIQTSEVQEHETDIRNYLRALADLGLLEESAPQEYGLGIEDADSGGSSTYENSDGSWKTLDEDRNEELGGPDDFEAPRIDESASGEGMRELGQLEIVYERGSHSDRDIQQEIANLEAERLAFRLEREHDSSRPSTQLQHSAVSTVPLDQQHPFMDKSRA